MTLHQITDFGKNNVIFSGIDGCRTGWAAVSLNFGPYGGAVAAGFPNPALIAAEVLRSDEPRELKKIVTPSILTLIDIPIGLPNGPEERKSDILVRKLLGKRGSAVFPVPVRDAVYIQSYREGCDINFRARGKKFSKQLWNICPKIREIDQFLLNDDSREKIQEKISESSPEYAFRLMAGRPLLFSKRVKEGRDERLKILDRYVPGTDDVITAAADRHKGSAGVDDFIDAFGLAVSAALTKFGRKVKIPEHPDFDENGVPVQAVFGAPPPTAL